MIDAPTHDELGLVVTAMADGLHADPGWTHVVPDDHARLLAGRTLIGHAARTAFRDGTVLVAREDGAIRGGIIWAAPGEFPPRWTRQLPAAAPMVGLTARIGARTVRELSRFGQAIDQALPPEPVWYVQALSVTPAGQGRGLGAALLGQVLAKSDATSVPCYLDTGKQANVAYYQRFGFALLDERVLWQDGPTIWRLQRQSQGAAEVS